MSNTFDGLANIYQLSATIDQLKQSQQNSAAAANLNGATNTTDPDTFLLQQQQSFNTMLNSLMTSPNDEADNNSSSSSDIFSSLINTNQTSSLASTANLQLLNKLEQNSALLGKEVIYLDSAGAQNSGVVSRIMIDQSSNPIFVLSDGKQIAIQAILGIK